MFIGFVFTNYNNSKFTVDAIRSIFSNDGADKKFKIVILDNNSDIRNIELLNTIKDEFSSVHLIFNKINIGYFKGLNKGIDYLRNNYKKINHIVIGNNDLIFSKNFINAVREKHSLFHNYPIISPNIITLDGVHQNPHVVEKISRFRQIIYDLYYSNFYLAIIIEKIAEVTHLFTDRKDEQQFKIAQEIYQGYGACYILGPLFFENFKELWSPSFIMHEEYFLAEQLYSKGYKTYYEPSIIVRHHCHSATKELLRKKRWELSRDAHRLCKKFIKDKKLELT